jgi:VWFA-related protein
VAVRSGEPRSGYRRFRAGVEGVIEKAITPRATRSWDRRGWLGPRDTNLIVLFFDWLTIESAQLARQGALDFVARNSSKATRFAVFSGDRKRFEVPLTNDLVAVRKGVEAATFGSTSSEGAVSPLLTDTTGRSAAGDSSALQIASDLDTIEALEAVARALEGAQGRRTILYFAAGWQFPLKVRPQYEEAISTATRANVTVHTFDARGLEYRKLVAVTPVDRMLRSWSAKNRGGPFGGSMTPVTDDRGTPAESLAGPNLEELAEDTGGLAIVNTNDLRAGLARISEELRHYYELVYAAADSTNDGTFRRISVQVSRPGVRIRTRKGYFATPHDASALPAYELPLSEALAPQSAREFELPTGARQSGLDAEEKTTLHVVPGGSALAEAIEPRAPTPDASLVPILERAARYVVGYEESFRNLVAEEIYSQSAFGGTPLVARLPAVPSAPGVRLYAPAPRHNKFHQRRRTRAELVFVPLPGDVPWTLFRDVFEVDGRKVRDRERRLETLFQHPSPSALTQARRIVEESQRYNIGGAARTINVPTMPLVFLHPRNQSRFSFAKGGQRRISGVAALEIRFEEVARPTVVTTSSGDSLPAHGSFWIDSSRGVVLRTEVVFRFEPSLAEASVETDYELQPALQLWVPVEMKERYRNLPDASRTVFGGPTEATAHYSNFRQFSVTVQEGAARVEGSP